MVGGGGGAAIGALTLAVGGAAMYAARRAEIMSKLKAALSARLAQYSKVWSVRNRALEVARLDFLAFRRISSDFPAEI